MLTDHSPNTIDLARVGVSEYYGTVTIDAETTAHPALAIAPATELHRPVLTLTSQLRFTGGFELIHTPTDQKVNVRYPFPLHWLRRYAAQIAPLADWHTATGRFSAASHPLHPAMRTIADHTARCWVQGIPIRSDLRPSLIQDPHGDMGLVCCNPDCESSYWELAGFGDDGQDAAVVAPGEEHALYEHAPYEGWRLLEQVPEANRWLCEDCCESHQPAPEHIRRRVRG